MVPEDVRPKFKPVGKIDLDSLKRRKKPAVVEPAEVPVVQEGPAKPESENKKPEVEKVETKTEEPALQQLQIVEKEETKQPEMKAEELKPEPMEEGKSNSPFRRIKKTKCLRFVQQNLSQK